jgi:3-oxoacyl-ACP reductase-like protein
MKKYAPLATLVAVVLLGAVLLVVNMLGTPQKPENTAAPAAVAASAPAAAPAEAPPAPAPASAPAAAAPSVAETAYTGRSAGNEVTVTIAVKDGKGVAYVCDGKKVEAWMEGALDGDKLTLQGKSGSLSATVDAKASLGELTVDGAEWPFSAKGVAAPAGLYQDRAAIKSLGVRAVTKR